MSSSGGAEPVPIARPRDGRTHTGLLALMMSMFFAFGFCTVLVDTMVPKFKAMFALSYTEVMLTQFCYFGAYFIVSAPAGWLLSRIGYLQAMVVGLLLMACGAGLFAPAALLGTYPAFLAALFVVAAGVTIVQVAANPVTALAGPQDQAPSRLTLAQAFNSFATMLGPQFGAWLILAQLAAPPPGLPAAALTAFRHREAHVFVAPLLGMAAVLLALAALCWRCRAWSPPVTPQGGGSLLALLRRPRLMFGALSIFAYVGAEVAIGSSLANYLMQSSVLGVAPMTAGRLVSVYWGGAMVGRFIGAGLLRRAPTGLLLTISAVCAGGLAVASASSAGLAAAMAVLAIGLFNSIMFPTIFTLAIEGLGEDTPEASGIICLAIVGGGVVPLLTGAVADAAGLSRALIVPALCYGWIAVFGGMVWRTPAPHPPG